MRNRQPAGDGAYYHIAANLLADGRGYIHPYQWTFQGVVEPTANHPPAWTTLLAVPSYLGLNTWTAHQITGVLVGIATVVLVALVGRRVAGDRVGLIAAGFAAVYPHFWIHEQQVISETLLLTGTAVVLLVAYRFLAEPSVGRICAVGAACGALVLVRLEQLLLVVLLIVPLALSVTKLGLSQRLKLFLLSCVAMGAVVAPWFVYNTVRFEKPVLTTATGQLVSAANCDLVYEGELIGYFSLACWPPDVLMQDRPRIEMQDELTRIGTDYARDNLSRVPAVVLAREGRTWSLFRPAQQMEFDGEWGSDVAAIKAGLFGYWILAALAIAGSFELRRRRVPVFPLLAFIALVAISVALAFGQTRYRVSAEVSLVVLAAVTADAIIGIFTRSRLAASAGHEP